MRICLVSGADELKLRSYINHYIYAREHGLDYRLECGLDDDIRTKFDYKTSVLRRLLDQYDWLVWLDDDTYFTNFKSDGINELISSAEAAGKFLVVAEGPLEPNGFWSKINTGVFAIKNSPRGMELLRRMHETPLQEVREWWDDDRDGLFTNGDQDQMWYILNKFNMMEYVDIVSHSLLNSRGHYYINSLSDNLVMHFCGYPDKKLGVVQFSKRFSIGQELVPQELMDKYSSRVQSPMNVLEYNFRSIRQKGLSKVKGILRPYYNKYFKK